MAREDYRGLEITGGPWFDEAEELEFGAELLEEDLAGDRSYGPIDDEFPWIGDVGGDPFAGSIVND